MRDDRNKCGPAENGPAILSRRSLLELAGIAVATAALPSRAVMANPFPSMDTTGPGDRENETTHSGHGGGDDFGFAVNTWARSAAICRRLWWERGRDGACLENCMWPDRGSNDEWGVGSCRRNRRFPRPVAVASRLRGSARCPRGGGTVWYQRDTLPARSDAWL